MILSFPAFIRDIRAIRGQKFPCSMPASVDHPRPGVPFDPAEFWINGWLWLEGRHADLAAVEAWRGERKLGAVDVAAMFERPDVSAVYGIPAGTRTGLNLSIRYPEAPTHPFAVSLRGRLNDGTLTNAIVTREMTPPSPEHDPLRALRTRVPPNARGLEIGAHARPVAGLAPYFTDAVASFAGTNGRADFLADALALPLSDATLDYLCSSHVLEHLPNPLAALHEWQRVLRPGGWLYLVVPDKRYTFDVSRPVTTVKHLLGDFLREAPVTGSAAHVDEFVYQTDWSRLRPDCPSAERTTQQAAVREAYLRGLQRGEPIDIHFHTFMPESLKELLRATGFIGGKRARFELVMEAERYPPDRIDGIALLLRKRARGENETLFTTPATFALAHTDSAIAPLPLVCPLSLERLHIETAADGARALVAKSSGRRYPHQGALPVLLPPPASRPQRPWSRRSWRIAHHLAAQLRLAFAPAVTASAPSFSKPAQPSE